MKSSTSLISKLLDETGVSRSPAEEATAPPTANVPQIAKATSQMPDEKLVEDLKRLFGDKLGATPMD